MKSLTVLYDAGCGLCVRSKGWVQKQSSYVAVSYLPQGGSEATRRYPGLRQGDPPEELIVVDDVGRVYRDDKAWLMILYALRRYRPLAMRLAKPGLNGLARRAYHWVSSNRALLSSSLGLTGYGELRRSLADAPEPPRCQTGQSNVTPFPVDIEVGDELILKGDDQAAD
jgi:predicted DCC family thiol-disulfide oxidoreductase YuxK